VFTETTEFLIYVHRHLRKTDRLSKGPNCLTRLQGIVVPVTIVNIMAPLAVPMQNQNKNIPMALPST